MRIVVLLLACLIVPWTAATSAWADATCDGVALPPSLDGVSCAGDVVIAGGTVSTLPNDGTLDVGGNLTIESGATLQVTGSVEAARILVGGDLRLQTGATIDLKGQSGVTAPAGTGGAGRTGVDTCAGSGAGHGARGGSTKDDWFRQPAPGGTAYGIAEGPRFPGSLGGAGKDGTGNLVRAGGAGGGAVRIIVNGLTVLDGNLNAAGNDGEPGVAFNIGSGGGGSGGSILLRTTDLVTHNPGVRVTVAGGDGGSVGGDSFCQSGGGGAGGRVAIYFSGSNGLDPANPGLDGISQMTCTGGAGGDNLSNPGGNGSCLLSMVAPAPILTAVTPGQVGQGASNVSLSLTGDNFNPFASIDIDGAVQGFPAGGVTIETASVSSATSLNAVISVDSAATPGTRTIRVINPDLAVSEPGVPITITPAPAVSALKVDGVVISGLPRGFSGVLQVEGTDIQTGAEVTFDAPWITITGTAVVDTIAQVVFVPIHIPETAPVLTVAVGLLNPDGGASLVNPGLDILSVPVIDQLSRTEFFVGESMISLVVTGSGFIDGAALVSGSADFVVHATTFDGFNQLRAVISVPVEASLADPLRSLWVDNGDGGISPATSVSLLAVPATVNQGDLLYGDGSLAPKSRYWNGFGWSVEAPLAALPDTAPEKVLIRSGLIRPDALSATVDGAGNLRFQQRSGDVWGGMSTPVPLAGAAPWPVDASAIAGTGAYLAVFGQAGMTGPAYQVFDGVGTIQPVPVTDARCSAAGGVARVRLMANTSADQALLAYATADGALCAIVWTGTAFDPATETVLAGPGELPGIGSETFDVTFRGTAALPRGMIAWAPATGTKPLYAFWDGAGYTFGEALNAGAAATQTITAIRLASSRVSDRIMLVNRTSSGELFAQGWGGNGWGETVEELPQQLVASPLSVSGDLTGRPFDVVWSSIQDRAVVAYGLAGVSGPEVRSWTPSGWEAAITPGGSAGLMPARWLQLASDPASGNILMVTAGWDGVATGPLTAYAFDGASWRNGLDLVSALSAADKSFDLEYRTAQVEQPVITATSYAGVSPAALAVSASEQTVVVTGSGFLNTPSAVFSHAGIVVTGVTYETPNRISLQVNVGPVPPGTYALTVTNPDGQTASILNGLQVLEPPGEIAVSLGAGAPACTPSLPGVTACAHQDSTGVPVVVQGRGIVAGASVVFLGEGVTFVGPAAFTDLGGGVGELRGVIDVAGVAPPGASGIRVVNPDSSFADAAGVFEVVPLIQLDSVFPDRAGTGARNLILTVDGRNFQPGVLFGFGSGVLVESVTRLSDTRAQVLVNVTSVAVPGARPVTATNPDGGQVVVTSPALFTVEPGPVVTGIAPRSGHQGTTVRVTVDGTELSPLAADGVRLSGDGLNIVLVSSTTTQLVFDVVIDQGAAFDLPRDLTIFRDNLGQITLPQAFTVVPVPIIGNVSPAGGTVNESGKTLTLTGSGFTPDSVVSGEGLIVRGRTVVDPMRIDVVVDTGPVPGVATLSVTNPDGQVSNAVPFTVSAAVACVVDGGTVVYTVLDTTACSSLTVSSGTLVLSGDMTLHVTGDVQVTGGSILVDPGAGYVRLWVEGNLTVGPAGAISATGTGLAGGELGAKGEGLGGGLPSALSFVGDNVGLGGGYGGRGGGDSEGRAGGTTYDLRGLCSGAACFHGIPLESGSGGGSGLAEEYQGKTFWFPGGDGGGALVLDVAGAATIDGSVTANGTTITDYISWAADGTRKLSLNAGRGGGGGSGGSILILADQVSGGGVIQARGGDGQTTFKTGTGGGGGRVGVYHRTANTFAGALDCSGGLRGGNPSGQNGTCFMLPATDVDAISPASLAQGASGELVLIGTGFENGDEVIFRDAPIVSGPGTLVGSVLVAPYVVAADAPFQSVDVIVRHADQLGGIGFGLTQVVGNPLLSGFTPSPLTQGQTIAAELSGSFLEPPGAAVTFERAGVEVLCGGGTPCITVILDEAASGPDRLVFSAVSVAADAPVGAYDVRLRHQSGGQAVLPFGVVVRSPDGSVPALALASPEEIGEGLPAAPMQLFGYDFGVPPAFAVSTVSSDPASGTTVTFDPAGCPLTPSACVPDPEPVKRIDVLMDTRTAVTGIPVDLTVTGGAGASTLSGAVTINPRPQLTGLSPLAGVDMINLTITGSNFALGALVAVDDPLVLVEPLSQTGTSIDVRLSVPASLPATALTVRVTNPDGGYGELGGLTVNPAPVVSSVNPGMLATGDTVVVTVQGQHFHPDATVSFGAGIAVDTVVVVDATTLNALVNVSPDAPAGGHTVTVTNPNGLAGSLDGALSVNEPVVLHWTSPAALGVGAGSKEVRAGRYQGRTVTLYGTGISPNTTLADITFSSPEIVRLTADGLIYTPGGKWSAYQLRFLSYSAVPLSDDLTITTAQIQVMVPPDSVPGNGTVTVRNPDGTSSTVPFAINPGPVVSQVTPYTLVRGQRVDAAVEGFSFDDTAWACIGENCDIGADSSPVAVVAKHSVTSNRIDLTLQVAPDAPVGAYPATVVNGDFGRFTATEAVLVVAGFSVDPATDFTVPIGGGPSVTTVTGSGFVDTPRSLTMSFLLPDGTVDPELATTVTYIDGNNVQLGVSATGAAVPGVRTLRVTNGDDAIVDIPGYLLVTNPAGPTIGMLQVPALGGGYRDAELGLDGLTDRIVTGVRLSGSGFSGTGFALAFGRPGIGISDLVVTGDTLAEFTLTLAPATVPGAAQLTATADGVSDVRDGVLQVNVAPVISALTPGMLVPGERTSVIIAGAGLVSGARAEVAPDGVFPVDLDPDVPGTQIHVVSGDSARGVLDASATAGGLYTLKVINPDGGVGRNTLMVMPEEVGRTAKLASLGARTDTALAVADWPGYPSLAGEVRSGAGSTELPYVAANIDRFTQLAANPMDPGQYLLGVGRARVSVSPNHGFTVLRTRPDGTTWEPLETIADTSGRGTRAFDLAYEHGGAGRALMVYGSGTSLFYKLIHNVPSASGPVEDRGLVLVGGVAPGAVGQPRWVRLIPEPDGQRILVLYKTDVNEVQAMIWDGAADGGLGAFISQFGDGVTPLSGNGVGGFYGISKAGFSGTWLPVSGKVLAVWSEQGTNALFAVTWDEVSGWSMPQVSDVGMAGSGALFVEARAARDEDRVAVLAFERNGTAHALTAHFWVDGWQPAPTVLASHTITWDPLQPDRGFGMGWESTGRLVTLFRATTRTLGMQTWTPDSGWSGTYVLPDKYSTRTTLRYLRGVEVVSDPDSDQMVGLATVQELEGGINNKAGTSYLFHWDGVSWSRPQVVAPAVYRSTLFNLGAGIYADFGALAMGMAFEGDAVPPDPVTLTQVDRSSVSATVSWVAPGDNGSTGQAGGYDIRWSAKTIVDDSDPLCAGADPGVVCFSDANQIASPPTPGAPGTVHRLEIPLGAVGTYTVALRTGDRPNRVDAATGLLVPRVNVSALSNVLTVSTDTADPIPPEAVNDLAAAAGADPGSMVTLTWTGVGDDGGVSPTGPVRWYDLRMARLPIADGGVNNFDITFEQAEQVALLAPAVDGGGGTRGVVNSHTVTGLESGVTYYFAVKGLDEDPTVPTPISNVASHTTALITPNPVTDLVIGAVAANDVTLSWTVPGGGATSYDLRIATSPIGDDAAFAAASQVSGVPLPGAEGTRQLFTVEGLLPETDYWFALKGVRYQTIDNVYTRLAPALTAGAVAQATTGKSAGGGTRPSTVDDLAVVAGTVRSHEARLTWSAPNALSGRALRYDMIWSLKPLAMATPSEQVVVPLPLLPAAGGETQEYTLAGLPENTFVYVALISYDNSGLQSGLSNEVRIHTALRAGMNPVTVPGMPSVNDVNTLFGPFVGTCEDGAPPTGSGPVTACNNGQPPVVTAYRWDPAIGLSGDFVAMAGSDPVEPGHGYFLFAPGTMAVLDVGGFDQPSYAPLPLADNAPALVANPYYLPVAVNDLRVKGDDGSDRSFAQAVADGIVDPDLFFYTVVDGVLQFVPVGAGDLLLPYRSYFLQPGVAPAAGVAYFLEVPHP